MKELNELEGYKILVGVCGSIAAYKTAGLVSSLNKAKVEVQVVMTEKATDLVGPQTYQALSSRSVLLDIEERKADHAMDHIASARWADLMLISPCTANTIAALALGMGSNLLETLYLAFDGPIILAPAMNPVMWSKPSVQRNIEQLRDDGCIVLEPESGETACGEQGRGRLVEEAIIIKKIHEVLL